MSRPRTAFFATVLACLVAAEPGAATSLDGLAVTVENRTTPALCTGAGNALLTLSSAETRRFTIEAAHPAWAPAAEMPIADLIGCDRAPAAESEAQAPSRVTLFEDMRTSLVGTRRPGLFRANTIPVRVGDRQETGLDTLELWVTRDGRTERVLVLEPGTSLVRLRPLSPTGRSTTDFGAGVVVGPLEADAPRVAIESIAYAPRTETLQLAYVGGGGAALRPAALDRAAITLEVVFDRPIEGRPFAAVRGDFVTGFASELADVAVREADAPGWTEAPVTAWQGGTVTDLWAGRLVPSRVAPSAPDLALGRFEPR